jgi:hypothetical protein
MQEVSLQNFKQDIDSIREYIKHINLINNIALNNRDLNENALEKIITTRKLTKRI